MANRRLRPPLTAIAKVEGCAAGRESFRVYTRSARRRGGRWVHVWSALTHTRWPPWHPLRRWRTADARRVHAVHGPPTSPHAWVVRDSCSLVVGRYHHPPSVTAGGSTTPAAHATVAAASALARPSVLYFATAAAQAAHAALPPQPPPSSSPMPSSRPTPPTRPPTPTRTPRQHQRQHHRHSAIVTATTIANANHAQ